MGVMADPAGKGMGIVTELPRRKRFRHLATDLATLGARGHGRRQGRFGPGFDEDERRQAHRRDETDQPGGAFQWGNRSARALSGR